MSELNVTIKPKGCKLLRVHAKVSDPPTLSSRILSLTVNGDFFAIPEEGFEKIEKNLAGCPVSFVATSFDKMAEDEGLSLAGISGAAIQEALVAGIEATGSPKTATD
jgi:hypothetical protein